MYAVRATTPLRSTARGYRTRPLLLIYAEITLRYRWPGPALTIGRCVCEFCVPIRGRHVHVGFPTLLSSTRRLSSNGVQGATNILSVERHLRVCHDWSSWIVQAYFKAVVLAYASTGVESNPPGPNRKIVRKRYVPMTPNGSKVVYGAERHLVGCGIDNMELIRLYSRPF
ncbi:hypothetical protein J6590_103776 [Homalodisca vitripennis]|nr:hypothetical protein J6590_103776 [Homalodisca vitripennis]